jgi:hypothetical protein
VVTSRVGKYDFKEGRLREVKRIDTIRKYLKKGGEL